MTQKTFDGTNLADLAALASEACDLWQEHLTACASDPHAQADLLRLMEPQRQMFANLFADYTTMMQTAAHASAKPDISASAEQPAPKPTARAAPAATAYDDSALRLAQFAHRVATLEQHISGLERRLDALERRNDAGPAGASNPASPAKP